jgi:hypothetical protein
MSELKFDGNSMQSKNILCDIEGTTTSISFVKVRGRSRDEPAF